MRAKNKNMEDSNQKFRMSEKWVCEVVSEALLFIYDSKAEFVKSDIEQEIASGRDEITDQIGRVITALFDYKDPFLKESSDENRHTVLTANSLWFIEDCFMHDQEVINDMNIAYRALSRTKFLGLYEADL